jgi:outer membrane lipoprotein SlyB
MEENKSTNRIHPLVAGAAVAVMLASLTGVAAITGLIPSSNSAPTPAQELAAAQAPATTPVPMQKAPQSPAANTSARAEAPRVAQAPAACSTCGTVESVQAHQQQAQGSGVGMVAGAVLGGILGNQVGSGNGRTLATVAGAAGGGYAGNEVEKRTRATTTYQVLVRMEDGRTRSFSFAQQPGWNIGDRVRVVNGHLTSRA